MFAAAKFPALPGTDKKVLYWLKNQPVFLWLDYTACTEPYGDIRPHIRVGAGARSYIDAWNAEKVDAFIAGKRVMTMFAYDLKNRFENLQSDNPEPVSWPECFLFEPEIELEIFPDEIRIYAENPQQIWDAVQQTYVPEPEPARLKEWHYMLNRNQYMERCAALHYHIRRGDIYEVNFCNAISATPDQGNPFDAYYKLAAAFPSPFRAFFRLQEKYALCASPERFVGKQNNRLVSQPIKGTAPRNSSPDIDAAQAASLTSSLKERTENIMIVDLVRNDLSRISSPGSVTVEELCAVYAFPSVFQMISTIASTPVAGTTFSQTLEALFPMGSMTGCPKIRAMEIIEAQECFKRGIFSGSLGYLCPGDEWQLNVVIRTIQWNTATNTVFYPMGSAITYLADPEKEWEECLVKAAPFNQVFLADEDK